VERILAPTEPLGDWPVEGTTGYEFLNESTALFVNPEAEESLTDLYQEFTGETRSFAEIAAEAKLEQARVTFDGEVEWLEARLGEAGRGLDIAAALAAFQVYRTYVDPDLEEIDDLDRKAVRDMRIPERLASILLLEERGHDSFVIRFQQVVQGVVAKGVEDTALYRYHRLLALNEVGGEPSRWCLTPEDFHLANLRRAERFPRQLLATQTHDTKRSGHVRARLAALTWFAEDWCSLVRSLAVPDTVHANDAYLAAQTLVGAWPLSQERLEAYLEKALREGKLRSNWLDPDTVYEQQVKDYAWSLGVAVQPFTEQITPLARRISLAQTLLNLTCPGVPDIYQGDEVECLSLVDPDNRRPFDWEKLSHDLTNPPSKLALVRQTLKLRAENADLFASDYRPVDAGADVLAFTRGDSVLVAVSVSQGGRFEVPSSWRDVFGGAFPLSLCFRS